MAQLPLTPVRRPPPTDDEAGAFQPRAMKETRPTRLAEKDAIDLWLARWLRTPRAEIRQRYNVDARRIYEVWEEITFIGSRQKALAVFEKTHPGLVGHVDTGRHRRFARSVDMEGQPALFAALPETKKRK